MTTLITLNFAGNFDNGFSITLLEEGKNSQYEVNLEANPKLKVEFQKWQQNYLNSLRVARGEYIEPEDEFPQQNFIKNFKSWLRILVSKIREIINNQDQEVGVVIRSDDDVIIRLPWHELEDDLFRNQNCFGHSIITIGHTSFNYIPRNKTHKYPKIRMLAVFGDSEGIDTKFDENELKNLDSSNDLELKVLPNPTKQELKDAIEDKKGWQIFFFAGHSSNGSFKINKDENIEIKDLRFCIDNAIRQGLRLVFFNSCDGLKLAQQLGDHNLPQTIVMRENVPDKAAQEFLKIFINNFAERGKSLYSSMLEARDALGNFEEEFPGIKALPIIYQTSNEKPLCWKDMKMPDWMKFFHNIKDKVIHFKNQKVESWNDFWKKERQELKFRFKIRFLAVIITFMISYVFFQDPKPDKPVIIFEIDKQIQKHDSITTYSLTAKLSDKDYPNINLIRFYPKVTNKLEKAIFLYDKYPPIDLVKSKYNAIFYEISKLDLQKSLGEEKNNKFKFEFSNKIKDFTFNFIYKDIETDAKFGCKILINNQNELPCEIKEKSYSSFFTLPWWLFASVISFIFILVIEMIFYHEPDDPF